MKTHQVSALLLVAPLLAIAFFAPNNARADLSLIASSADRVAFGKKVTVAKGAEVDEVVSFGGDILVQEDAHIRGDLVAMGGDIDVERGALIDGDVVSFGGSLSLGEDCTVRGDASAMGGDLRLARGARVLGSRFSAGGDQGQVQDRDRDPSSGAGGQRSRLSPPPRAKHFSRAGILGKMWGGLISTSARTLAIFVLGFLALLASPRRIDRMRRPLLPSTLHQTPKLFAIGLFASLAMIPLTVLLIMTVVGILILPVLYLIYFITLFLGWTVLALAIGRRLLTAGKRTPVRELALGLLVLLALTLLSQLPLVGFIISILLFGGAMVGSGAVLATRFGHPPAPSEAELWPPPGETTGTSL